MDLKVQKTSVFEISQYFGCKVLDVYHVHIDDTVHNLALGYTVRWMTWFKTPMKDVTSYDMLWRVESRH